jgi:hypothetical protein
MMTTSSSRGRRNRRRGADYGDEDDSDEQEEEDKVQNYKQHGADFFMSAYSEAVQKQEEPKEAKKEEDTRTVEQIHSELKLEDQTRYFMDIWQSKMNNRSKLFLPNSLSKSANFSFYKEGHDLWKQSYDF